MRQRFFFLFLLFALVGKAVETEVTPSDFSSAYANAADGDVLVLGEGAYGGTLTFPDKKVITLKAADEAEVLFGCLFRCNNADATGGGIVLDGVKVSITDSYFINLDAYGDIRLIAMKNCEITNIARCFLRTNGTGRFIEDIEFYNCLIHDCGSGGWNFMYPKHTVKRVTTKDCTLFNYANGESFFFANGADASNDFVFVFTNNTVYKWGKSNDRALCKTEGKYSGNSVYTFADNIVYKGGADNVKPQMIQATSGTLVAQNNLVVGYGGYNMGGAAVTTIDDLTLESLGVDALSFPNPDEGDFTIVSSSPLATASTLGGVLGASRWLKVVTQAVDLQSVAWPAEGGVVSPAKATYDVGDMVSLTATANYGFRFKEWQDADGKTLSTENPYQFEMTADISLTGVFSAVDTYALTVNKAGEGAKWGGLKFSPEPVNGIYETGTEVTVSIVPNSVTSFLYWEDTSTETSRMVTMDSDRELTATFDVIPFIVAWDFNPAGDRGNRMGDYFFETDNTGVLMLYNGDGSSTNWGASTRTFGGKQFDCARRYTERADMDNPRSFVARFNVSGYDKINIHSYVAADNKCVHRTQLLQYSATGRADDFTTLTSVTLDSQPSSEWIPLDGELDTKGLDGLVYLRWIGDTGSELIATPGSSDTEGFYLADVVVYADKAVLDDHDAPILVSSSPSTGTTGASARGNIILNFNERVKAGEGLVTLNGETLVGLFGSKTATYAYRGLGYGETYTLHIGEGAITDLSGNALPATDIRFTVMARPQPAAKVFDAVVAKDGTGDYTTIQAAIDAAPSGRTVPYLIFVKNGEYEELVKIPSAKTFIHLIGQDKEKTIIKYFINNGGTSDVGWEHSTNNPASSTHGYQGVFQVDATDFYTENITYFNRWGVEQQSGPMGLAMRSCNDRQAFYNCKFRSFQDTWFTTTTNVSDRHYVNNCWIEGAVDYFYGAGDVYVENTTFYNARSTGSVLVAPCHKAGTKYGYVFDHCVIDGKGSSHKLGRAWQNEPMAVFLNTTIKATLSPEGWSEWHIAPKLFAEYGSMDADGNPIDLNNRRTEYHVDNQAEKAVRQAVLTAEEAANYTYERVTEGAHMDGWNPRKFFEAVEAPADLKLERSSGELTWTSSDYAICYVVINEQTDQVVGFTTETSWAVSDVEASYTVRPVNEYGSLGIGSSSRPVEGIGQNLPSGNVISIAYYSLQGIRYALPHTGFNIVVRQLSDGTQQVSRMLTY